MAQKKKTTKTKKLHPGGSVPGGRGRLPILAVQGQKLTPAQRRRLRMMQRQRFQNPMMPTAGISQGRPVTGRTPMPGPAPNAEAMKRMQKLMREQQARYNAMQRSRPPRTARGPAPNLMTLDTARKNLLRQKLIDAARFPASGSRRKLTEAQRRAASARFEEQQKAARERRRGLGDKLEANRDNSTRGRRGRRLDPKYRNR